MLSALRISNLAEIEGAEVAFGPGLTVLTGETGAGKSILLGALGLLLEAHAAQYQDLRDVIARMEALGGDERALRERADLLRYQLNELESARPVAGEDVRLEEERRRLAAAERLRRAAGEAATLLAG